MAWKDFVLGVLGYIAILAITYYTSWRVEWLLIFSGSYFLGIVIAWLWEHWTGYEAVYSFVVTIVSFIVGLYLVLGKSALDVLMKVWCGIPPCVPMYWILLALVVGNAVYVARPYFNKLVQK